MASVTKAYELKGNRMEVVITPPDFDKFIRALDEHKVVMLTHAHKQAAETIKESVKWGFRRAQDRVTQNTAATVLYKGNNIRLYESGRLIRAIDDSKVNVTHNNLAVTGFVEIAMPRAGIRGKHGINRRNKGFPYPLAHLFGAGGNMRKFGEWQSFSLPRRDFLTEGLKSGAKKAATIMGAAYKDYYHKFIEPSYFNRRFIPFMWEREVSFSSKDMYSLALPPMSQYSVIGFGADFGSAFALSFNAFTVNSWFSTLAAGHAGMTKQTYIRSGRKTAYGR